MNFRIAYSVQRIAFSLFSAILLILSFPPFNVWVFAWVAFIPLFFALENQKPLKSFLTAYLTGFVFFLGTIYWLIHVTLPGMLAVVAYLALYFGLFGLVVNHTQYAVRRTQYERLFLIPAAWVTLEWVRGKFLFGGFGWNGIGVSQHQTLPLIQIASITGVYGVSALLVLGNRSEEHTS